MWESSALGFEALNFVYVTSLRSVCVCMNACIHSPENGDGDMEALAVKCLHKVGERSSFPLPPFMKKFCL